MVISSRYTSFRHDWIQEPRSSLSLTVLSTVLASLLEHLYSAGERGPSRCPSHFAPPVSSLAFQMPHLGAGRVTVSLSLLWEALRSGCRSRGSLQSGLYSANQTRRSSSESGPGCHPRPPSAPSGMPLHPGSLAGRVLPVPSPRGLL